MIQSMFKTRGTTLLAPDSFYCYCLTAECLGHQRFGHLAAFMGRTALLSFPSPPVHLPSPQNLLHFHYGAGHVPYPALLRRQADHLNNKEVLGEPHAERIPRGTTGQAPLTSPSPPRSP